MFTARFCAVLWMILLLALSLGLLLFACIHWRNAWSLFMLLASVVAFVVPDLCRNYRPFEELDMSEIAYDEKTAKDCRLCGWMITTTFLGGAYGIPVLAWYNAGFAVVGACVAMGSQTALIWSYALFLRVFGPFRNN